MISVRQGGMSPLGLPDSSPVWEYEVQYTRKLCPSEELREFIQLPVGQHSFKSTVYASFFFFFFKHQQLIIKINKIKINKNKMQAI